MKNNFLKTFRSRMLFNVLISILISLAVEIFFIFNMRIIVEILISNGFRNVFFGKEGIYLQYKVLFMGVVGVIAFTASFIMSMKPMVRYIRSLSSGMQRIAEGDLNTTVEILGCDEFASIARNMNQMTEEIKILMERERISERSKNDLITSVAHDLRTPLTSVIGYLELIKRKPEMDAETKEKYLDVAYSKAKHLQKLIEDLFGYTKMNHNEIILKRTRLDIVKLLEQMLDEFYPSFEQKKLEISYTPVLSSLMIEADGNLLARLFENLINNAIKYGADGKMIKIELNQEADQVVIKIINYGKVIPKEEVSHIFEKFYRVEQSRSQNTGGTGLGLAIAKSVVVMHGGTIAARSSLKGTVFEVKLPLKEPALPKFSAK